MKGREKCSPARNLERLWRDGGAGDSTDSFIFFFSVSVQLIQAEKRHGSILKLTKQTWMQTSFWRYYNQEHHKIPKISPGAYIFQTPFFKGLICGGAYIGRKICVTKSIVLTYSRKEIYVLLRCFCFVLFCFWGQFPSISLRGLSSEARINGGLLRYEFGGLYLEGLIHGGAYFRNFTVIPHHSQLRRKDKMAAFKTQFNKAKSIED